MKFYNDKFLHSWCIDCVKVDESYFGRFDDLDKEWGFSTKPCESEQEAYIDMIRRMANEGGSFMQVTLICAMVELELLPKNVKLWDKAAIIDGVPYTSHADLWNKKQGLCRMDEIMLQYRPIDSLGLTDEGKAVAEATLQEAVDEAKGWFKTYKEWEDSWVDGPQM